MQLGSFSKKAGSPEAQKLFINMKSPTPTAGPMSVATTIMTNGFAIITLYPALNS
jgi:hypothetical protein